MTVQEVAFEKSYLKVTGYKTRKGLAPDITSIGALTLKFTGARIVGHKLVLFVSSLAHSVLL